MPALADFPAGVSRVEEAPQAPLAVVVEFLVGAGKQVAYQVEGVLFPAAAPVGFFLHAAAGLGQAAVGYPDDVERVRDLLRPRQRLVVGGLVSPGQIQHRPLDALPPPSGAGKQPLGGCFSVFCLGICQSADPCGRPPPTSSTSWYATSRGVGTTFRPGPTRPPPPPAPCPPPATLPPTGPPPCLPYPKRIPDPRLSQPPSDPASPPARSPTAPPGWSPATAQERSAPPAR